MINTTNRSGTLPTKTISIVDTIACCKCDNNNSSYTRVRSISHIRSSMAAAPISFCFGAGEDIVTFSTSRPDRQNRMRLEPSTATSSFQVRKIQLPKEIIGLIQSSRRLCTPKDSGDYVEKSRIELWFYAQVGHTRNSCPTYWASRWYCRYDVMVHGRDRQLSVNTFSSEDLEVIAVQSLAKFLWLCQLLFLESKSHLLGNMLADWANFTTGICTVALRGGGGALAQHPWKILTSVFWMGYWWRFATYRWWADSYRNEARWCFALGCWNFARDINHGSPLDSTGAPLQNSGASGKRGWLKSGTLNKDWTRKVIAHHQNW